jgi:CheY-like chemotaxis protein
MAHTILLIDDDRVFQEKVKQVLERNGIQVVLASSWVDFTKAYYGAPSKPEVILFDVDLGSTLSGDKLLAAFNKDRETLGSARDTKLVLFSGLPAEELEARARQCGADGVIRKDSLTAKSGLSFLAQLRKYLR